MCLHWSSHLSSLFRGECRASDAVAMLLDKIRNRNPQVALAAMTVSVFSVPLECFVTL